MIEKLLRMYVMYMTYDVRSPTPHLFGPPGCGKSSMAAELARLVGKNLHIINVSRMSPLEVEGVQMPVDENTRLELLLSTLWSKLKEGDIVLFDEFLRGFPEVYNGLIDIFTSREVGGHVLPKVFIMAASNSTVAYDKALEDRLIHLPVPDIRKLKRVRVQLQRRMVDELGLLPDMATSPEMDAVFQSEILPTYDVLDAIGKGSGGAALNTRGQSMRKLIGMAQLREVQSAPLAELIKLNNMRAAGSGKYQYVFLLDGKAADEALAKRLRALDTDAVKAKMSEVQRKNLAMNLQLIQLEEARNTKEGSTTDDDDTFVDVDEPEFT